MRSRILLAEQGVFEYGIWRPSRLLNGDETDRGLTLHESPAVVRVKMQQY
jgi:hypothetical protein